MGINTTKAWADLQDAREQGHIPAALAGLANVNLRRLGDVDAKQ